MRFLERVLASYGRWLRWVWHELTEQSVSWGVIFLTFSICLLVGLILGFLDNGGLGFIRRIPIASAHVPVPAKLITHRVHTATVQPVDYKSDDDVFRRAGDLANAMGDVNICDLSPLACLQRSQPHLFPEQPQAVCPSDAPPRKAKKRVREGGHRQTVAMRPQVAHKFSNTLN